ncbi:ArsR/SmtB family transcription factor [Flexivirga sp. B27]
MITIELEAPTVTSIRWSVSPAMETLGWLQLTRDNAIDASYGAPTQEARELTGCPDVALAAALLPTDSGEPTADFLAPVPPAGSQCRTAELQFEQIRGTDPAHAATQLREAAGDRDLAPEVAAALEDGSLPARVADGLETFWQHGMSEVFTRAEAALRVEIDRCAQLVDGGLGAVLNIVHGRLSQHGIAPGADDQLHVQAPELVVIPTALHGARLAMRPWGSQPFVAYPISTPSEATDTLTGMRRLLGPTRAAILRQLSSARTTTELSGELRLAAATVSYHVKVMQRAGLLERSRRRHNVFYELSPTGRQLLASLP